MLTSVVNRKEVRYNEARLQLSFLVDKGCMSKHRKLNVTFNPQRVLQPSGTAMACLSGHSDSKNWPSGLQPVATEPDRAKQPRGEGQTAAEHVGFKTEEFRVGNETGMVRTGQRKKRLKVD